MSALNTLREIIEKYSHEIVQLNQQIDKLQNTTDSLESESIAQKLQLNQYEKTFFQQSNDIQSLKEHISHYKQDFILIEQRIKKLEEADLLNSLQHKARVGLLTGLVKYGPLAVSIVISVFMAIIALHTGQNYNPNHNIV